MGLGFGSGLGLWLGLGLGYWGCGRRTFCWPMRCTRSHAWSSAKGFHHGSHMTTVLAHVRLRPTPHLVRVRVGVRGWS